MNGVCGSFSIFSSAQYLLTNDDDYLWAALAFPLAGLLFDFFDGKIARWRNSSSIMVFELLQGGGLLGGGGGGGRRRRGGGGGGGGVVVGGGGGIFFCCRTRWHIFRQQIRIIIFT